MFRFSFGKNFSRTREKYKYSTHNLDFLFQDNQNSGIMYHLPVHAQSHFSQLLHFLARSIFLNLQHYKFHTHCNRTHERGATSSRSQLILSRLGKIPVFTTNLRLILLKTPQKTCPYPASPEGHARSRK